MAELVFDWLGARAERYSAVPSLTLCLRISETSGQRVDAIALRCQIRIEPHRRRYSEAEARTLGLIEGPPTVTVPMGATLASLEPVPAPKGFMNALRSKTVVK